MEHLFLTIILAILNAYFLGLVALPRLSLRKRPSEHTLPAQHQTPSGIEDKRQLRKISDLRRCFASRLL